MKSITRYLVFNTEKRIEFLNITGQVQRAVYDSNISEGLCLVNSMHIGSSVYVNDHEYGLHEDFEKWLEKLAPHAPSSILERGSRFFTENLMGCEKKNSN